MFFNSLFFPLFSLLFSSRTHSLSHAHTLSLLFARVVFRRLRRSRVVYNVERAAFQLLFLTFSSFLRREFTKKMSKKEGCMDSSFKRRKTKTFLFDFDSRLLGFISRGTFEKQKTTRSRPPQKHNTEQQQQQQQQQPQKLKRKNDFDDDNEHERCWHSQNYCEEQFHQQTKRWWFCSSRSE